MSNFFVLREYYVQYLKKIRGNSSSTIQHYLGALDTISSYLSAQQKINTTIYEITELNNLQTIKDDLFQDPHFIEKDERGHRMYSAGLNNYCRFASGDNFIDIKEHISLMDFVIPRSDLIIQRTETYKRSSIIKNQVIESVGYICEIDPLHKTFISESTNQLYMEGHHIIPMKMQKHFDNSLDVYANIISLCPICHRQLHFGLREDKIELLIKIYSARSERLHNCGLSISQDELIELAA
ncbi:MAG: HNH endonuclease [Ruminococcus sp.]|nr:HNH endonuclease [Ruminococcus sp.]